MIAFRIFLGSIFVYVLIYTGIAGFQQGWNLFPFFFGDILAQTWEGQFKTDFSCFLLLSGLWLSWRHHFSPGGLALGIVGVFGGILFLAPYLFVASFKANGDIKELFLGKVRTSR
jgi:hypothetical protein